MNISTTTSPFYTRPTWIEISQSSLLKNIKNIYKFINSGNKKVKICAIVKSNAYGHGLKEVASVIGKVKEVEFLGVTSIEEAILLREMGIKKQILLLGSLYPFDNFKYLLKYKITPTVASVFLMDKLEEFSKKHNTIIKFHLKVDTGMGRIGILPESIHEFIREYKAKKNLICEGIYTHFSSAAEDKEYTEYQINLFNDVYKKLYLANIKPIYVHTANSAAMLLYKNSLFNMVRPGLLIYGLLPFKKALDIINISNVLSLKSKIVFLKTLPKGRYISYSKTYCTKRKTRVATVPVGYADGFLRSLSNKGKVLVNGKFCNILGRVTMDMIMIDVTHIKDVRVGTEVVVIGRQKGNSISVEEVASTAGTINYEITARLSERIPRILVE
ncbi:MAG: alanine racemase [Elusimicrobiota bacterium]|nr:alanine racemase [Endomicrobiia bacterium]MDW8166276.1 alanine racemase [Elusimicrobiota bacterium]